VDLTVRQRRALDAICDTFLPRIDGLPSATELGVPQAIAEALDANPRESERKQTAQLLGLWDTALLTAVGGGGLRRFSSLPQERREAVMRSWCDSRVGQRRAAFTALRKAALLFGYMVPGPGGAPNPRWEACGYPGPLGPVADPPPKALEPLRVGGDTTLDCDVVVCGSGAGGGTAAGVLGAAGLDVVVLEAGDYYDDGDFDGAELGGYQRMYLNAGGGASADQGVGVLAGSCLGGGTVVNYTTSFRTPDDVREEWAGHGVPAFTSAEYDASLDAVHARLGINQEQSRPAARDEAMRRGLVELGWHVDSMPRNVRGCDQGEVCGYCGYGCRLGAKQSTVKTWLADAASNGARIAVRAAVDRVIVEAGAARGVEARTAEGHRLTVRARAVVAACGAVHTPALLRRSGLRNDNVGRHLKLHPATAVWGVFDDEVRPWEGTMQALYSDQHRRLDGGYGVKYETAPIHPSLLIAFAPWRSGAQHAALMGGLAHSTPIGVLLRDRDGGEVRVGRDGLPVVRYRLSDYDVRHVRVGVDGAARILEAAGARRIFSAHARWVAYEPGVCGSRDAFMADADACGYGPGRCAFNSFHIMGSVRMGGSPATSACDPRGETWDVRDLVVCDGSAFPTASGVNPMVSIEAIAHMNARGLAARLA
jgi:choline dehydrogenase-like flavoprotein